MDHIEIFEKDNLIAFKQWLYKNNHDIKKDNRIMLLAATYNAVYIFDNIFQQFKSDDFLNIDMHFVMTEASEANALKVVDYLLNNRSIWKSKKSNSTYESSFKVGIRKKNKELISLYTDNKEYKKLVKNTPFIYNLVGQTQDIEFIDFFESKIKSKKNKDIFRINVLVRAIYDNSTNILEEYLLNRNIELDEHFYKVAKPSDIAVISFYNNKKMYEKLDSELKTPDLISKKNKI